MAERAPERFGLYLVMTHPVAGYQACCEAAVAEGLRYVQLRMKDLPQEEVMAVARVCRTLTRGTSTRFIVNDSVEIARRVDADGVHLGQDDLSLDEARALWPAPGKLFGLSTHGAGQAKAAEAVHPDYIGVGPVFPTPTKAVADPTVGLAQMGRIIRTSPLTCVAIGGIGHDNLAAVLEAGAVNFAVVRAVMQSTDPRAAIAGLMNTWRRIVG